MILLFGIYQSDYNYVVARFGAMPHGVEAFYGVAFEFVSTFTLFEFLFSKAFKHNNCFPLDIYEITAEYKH